MHQALDLIGLAKAAVYQSILPLSIAHHAMDHAIVHSTAVQVCSRWHRGCHANPEPDLLLLQGLLTAYDACGPGILGEISAFVQIPGVAVHAPAAGHHLAAPGVASTESPVLMELDRRQAVARGRVKNLEIRIAAARALCETQSSENHQAGQPLAECVPAERADESASDRLQEAVRDLHWVTEGLDAVHSSCIAVSNFGPAAAFRPKPVPKTATNAPAPWDLAIGDTAPSFTDSTGDWDVPLREVPPLGAVAAPGPSAMVDDEDGGGAFDGAYTPPAAGSLPAWSAGSIPLATGSGAIARAAGELWPPIVGHAAQQQQQEQSAVADVVMSGGPGVAVTSQVSATFD